MARTENLEAPHRKDPGEPMPSALATPDAIWERNQQVFNSQHESTSQSKATWMRREGAEAQTLELVGAEEDKNQSHYFNS